MLDRCSVFAGGFDLESATAVGGGGELDEYTILDLLDALVRKSLLTVDRSGARTRYGTLETIRQFAEDRLASSGTAEAVRNRHAAYFAGKEDEILALSASLCASLRSSFVDLRTARWSDWAMRLGVTGK